MGAGMAFPWKLIRTADLAHPGIVEDLKLGLDLAAAGHPPFFCPTAHVTSQFATTGEAPTFSGDAGSRVTSPPLSLTLLAYSPLPPCAAILDFSRLLSIWPFPRFRF